MYARLVTRAGVKLRGRVTVRRGLCPPGRRIRIRLVFGFLVLLHLAHGLAAAAPLADRRPDAYRAGGTNEVKAAITAETWPSDSAGYIGSDTTSAHTRSPIGHIAGLVDESAGCLGMGTG